MITTSQSTIDRFALIATELVQQLIDDSVIKLHKDAAGTDLLNLASPEGQQLIKTMTTKIYEGLIKDMNTHLALED